MPAWLDAIVRDAHRALLDGSTPDAKRAKQYLLQRGVAEADLVTFQLGFVIPDQPIAACTDEFKEWSGALPNRIVFPLTSVLGEVIGIQTKPLEPKGYQLFYAYPRGLYPYMFGTAQAIDAICDRHSVVIVEGVFDCFAVRRVVPNVVAVMSAGVSNACRHFFHRYVRRVIALLDMDEAGRKGCHSLQVEGHNAGFSVIAPQYSSHDPGDLYNEGKLTELARCVSLATDVATY